MRKKLLLALVAALLTLLAADLVLRLFIEPSERAYGSLFEVELPPHRLIPWEEVDADERIDWSREESRWVAHGTTLTYGDLHGILREDPVLGHAPRENTVSTNGWWQANNYGARTVREISAAKPVDQRRIFIFGGSYAHGARVTEQETWGAYLQQMDPELEVWSFGVDGYGMGQAYLRFRQITAELDYDLALLVFVPDKSLWRDINTIRYIGRGWESYKINPRFVVEGDRLRLVPSPYQDLDEMTARNREAVTDELRDHLRSYEGFYLRSKYEPIPLLGRSILFKRLLATLIDRREEAMHDGLMDPGSEAQAISRRIFEAMHRESVEQGKRFALVILPSMKALRRYRKHPDYAASWDALVRDVCPGEYPCFDLMESFVTVPTGFLDRGYDRSHFGPKSNRHFARFVRRHLLELPGFLSGPTPPADPDGGPRRRGS